MTARTATATVVVLGLFGAGYAAAGEGGPSTSRPRAVTDGAPQTLAVERVPVRAGLGGGIPARLRPEPTPRPRRRASVRTTAPAPPAPAPPARPAPVSAPAPAPASTPAPAPPPPVTRPAPAPPAPKPPPAPPKQTPSYVGSGFDDSG